MRKHWIKIVLGIIVLFLLVLVAVPLFINADDFRPTIEAQLSRALGRQITLGHLTFSLLKGSLDAEDISIADDPAFSTTPFLQAKALQIGVEVMPLIVHRQVQITRLTIDTPSINLLHAENGRWNFSSIGGAPASAGQSPQQVSALPDLTVGALDIIEGNASVSSVPAVRKPFVYSAINLSVKKFSFLKSFPFSLSATLPASGSLALTGTAGPLSQKNAADTPFQAKLQLKAFDPVAAGVLDPAAGISMKVDIGSDLISDGTSLISRGKIEADRLKLSRSGAPAPHPVNIDYEVSDDLGAETGKITDISIHAGAVAARITGTYRLTPQTALLDLHLSAPSLPIDQVEELLPTFGIKLPTGSKLAGGTLTADLAASGPVASLTVAGPVEVDNTTLQGFDLGSKIEGLNLLKSGKGTEIQTLRTKVHSTPQTTEFGDIYGNLPQLGSATGSGTVSSSEALDFKMIATLSSNNAVGAVANQAVNAVSGIVGGFLHPTAKPAAKPANRGIPITITGTASSPSIHANVLSALK